MTAVLEHAFMTTSNLSVISGIVFQELFLNRAERECIVLSDKSLSKPIFVFECLTDSCGECTGTYGTEAGLKVSCKCRCHN